MTESQKIYFFIGGIIWMIERFEDETDSSFAERSSFILAFIEDPFMMNKAEKYSFHHVNSMFKGCVYNNDIEIKLRDIRDKYLSLR